MAYVQPILIFLKYMTQSIVGRVDISTPYVCAGKIYNIMFITYQYCTK